ncbi:hypothetical protein NL676_013813 [Syzygium grande]|nr:hypothetical protein NL676_013813 [Syzygium grande]
MKAMRKLSSISVDSWSTAEGKARRRLHGRFDKVKSVRISGDSPLVLIQYAGTSRCLNGMSARYLAMAQGLLDRFDNIELEHKPRGMNVNASDLAQLASGVQVLLHISSGIRRQSSRHIISSRAS